MAEISLNNALGQIRSAKVKDRTDGLADLRHILSQNRRSYRLNGLVDKDYHQLFETLFRVTQSEKAAYAKPSKVARSLASARLSACAGTVRLAVEVGVQTLRQKTVKALIDHITQIVPSSDENYCEPLLKDYARALTTTLAYRPHVEHLSKDDWHVLVDFCIAGIQASLTHDDVDGGSHALANGSSRLVARNSRPGTQSPFTVSFSHNNDSGPRGSMNAGSSKTVDEFSLCLYYLFSTPNAPLLDKTSSAIPVLLALLRAPSTGGAHHAAFRCINAVISRSITEDQELARQTFRDVLQPLRRLWHTKSPLLKEEMLTSMIIGEALLNSILRVDDDEDCRTDLQGLFDVMSVEYCKRLPRDQLQLDDLRFNYENHGEDGHDTFETKTLGLRFGSVKSEQPWAILNILTSIFATLGDPLSLSSLPGDDDSSISRKRRKLSSTIDTLLQPLLTGSNQDKLFTLQMLVFFMGKLVWDEETMLKVLDAVTPILSSDSSEVAALAMLVLASAAYERPHSVKNDANPWLQVWQLCIRSVASPASSRASCHLMVILLKTGLVRYVDIADSVDTMLGSVDLHGPIEFTESAVELWRLIISSKARHNPGQIYDTSERVLRWLFTRWKPSHIQERQRLSQLSQQCCPSTVLKLLAAVLGIPHLFQKPPYSLNLGPIVQATLRCSLEKRLVTYLLLENPLITPSRSKKSGVSGNTDTQLPEGKFHALYGMAVDFIGAEIAALLREGPFSETKDAQTLNSDVARIATCVCVVAFGLASTHQGGRDNRGRPLKGLAVDLRGRIGLSVLRQEKPKVVADGLLNSLEGLLSSKKGTMLYEGVVTTALDFGEDFWQQVRVTEKDIAANGNNIDFDEDFDSQNSTTTLPEMEAMNLEHEWLAACTDIAAYRACLIARACEASLRGRLALQGIHDDSSLGDKFIGYLTSLPPHEFVSCRPFLKEYLESETSMSESAGSLLLEYLGRAILQAYDLERSEASLGTCLDVMAGIAILWTDREHEEIADLGESLYKWFIKVLNRGICSPHVHQSLALMLQRVIKVRPDYAKNLELESARTSLFRILSEGTIAVKFAVGQNISDVFGLFILKEHDAILDDIIASLPDATDWPEGIALRLFVVSHLGLSWATLLRRCIYAIFETAGHVPESVKHAKYCVELMSTSLYLPSSRELLKLFVSQIIFTWLGTETITTIPFSIFGYADLKTLLQDVQDEVTGQIVMRGRTDEAQQLAHLLSLPYDKLVEQSFSKCAAYCIARDAAVPPTRDMQGSGADVRIRKLLGKERYGGLISQRFPDILVTFFKTVDREDNIVKGFQKHGVYKNANDAFNEMMSYSCSTATLPASQQPSFKAGFLVDEIMYLSSRSPFDLSPDWPPALYVYILRELIDSIHPALGSLHACAIIRKIRILVSMAGKTALKDYPLEVTLHSLRPFLTDTHCAEESIGISRYVLSHGAPYLQYVPSFLAGLTVSTLASMKKFLSTPQESTTQESQFRATMNRAQEYHAWLRGFATDYSSEFLDEASERSFKAIVLSASQIQDVGNSHKGTFESDLLLELLEDRLNGSSLLNETTQNLILDLLCAKFEVPANFRDDILGSEKLAAEYVSAIWSTCQRKECGSEYLLWIARVLGRAYGGTGDVGRIISYEIRMDTLLAASSSSQPRMETGSRRAILGCLWKVLLGDIRRDVSLSQKTLQIIVTKALGTDLWSECEDTFPRSLLNALTWSPLSCPSLSTTRNEVITLQKAVIIYDELPFAIWIRQVCVALLAMLPNDIILSELEPILSIVDKVAEDLFPAILHLVLLGEFHTHQNTKQIFSATISQILNDFTESRTAHTRLILHSIIYLRYQALPHEHTKADRYRWLDFDYEQASAVAVKCRMYKTALLLLETGLSEANKSKRSRRSSGLKVTLPTELLLTIYRNLDDKDSFYGIRQPSSLSTMMEQLEYENAGFKSLSFRGAHFDGQIRLLSEHPVNPEREMVKVLDNLDLNGLSQAVLSSMNGTDPMSTEAMFRTARKLERWDLSSSGAQESASSTIFTTFQEISRASDHKSIKAALDKGFSAAMTLALAAQAADVSLHSALACLAVLSEVEDVVSSQGLEQLMEVWERLEAHNDWMLTESFDHVSLIVSCRQTLFSTVSKSGSLQRLLEMSHRDSRRIECRALVASTSISRHHGALQNALATSMYLGKLGERFKEQGLNVEAAARLEGSNVLWDQDEMAASIRMLQDTVQEVNLGVQDIHVGKPELLAKLGHRISEARLEKPDEIIKNYLLPAIKELSGVAEGQEAGQVFHEFAAFCDKQLQNPENLEDFQRVRMLRERKQGEVQDLERMIKSAGSQTKEKDNLENHRKKAQLWYTLDDREYQRLKQNREAFIRQSIENYLLALRACDNYDSDALRFSALWLEHSDSETANAAVSRYIDDVGSRKFASLMNQWTSRLLDASNDFQKLLSALVVRICVDHPYHGMYQVFASSKTKGGKDQAALSRNAAALNIVARIKANKRSGHTWLSVHNSNINFVRFASEKLDDSKYKPGSKVPLRKSINGPKLEQDIPSHPIPPPTMKIKLRADCDYSNTPLIVSYQSEFTIASGISMPKILTAFASDGRKYKQLFKGGNDDLRQDCIMEQVFEQVSNLLKSHRDTRQRNLGIRTYKVLPLTSTTGIIEFVSDTVPLHEYLLPAHQRHFPGDLKPNLCRKHIADVQNKSVEIRVKTFHNVCEKFHPVLHYFFMERFENPDEWFEKRLAYTRSMAANSILGYIMGLGDRHGHNILLDEKTGEVIHIDLGIAFEQGRVLPVPEVVPFRLTRDLVDAMGITKTEGVFRRCCEFTMDALRNELYSIMTILDVLRYDPLYSWSLSPVRLKRLQDNQTEVNIKSEKPVDDDASQENKQENEPGEADRALTVVSKKLSKTLSVTATVNELIQQATDERNLAVLFCGWAAYA